MYGHDEFLRGGLRERMERMGRVRPRTIQPEADAVQRPERRHAQVSFRPAQQDLRRRVAAMHPAHR
jgi:hypothetical protein